MEGLAKADIPTAVSIAPVIPGLNDCDIPHILFKARDAGAQNATFILLRLNDNVENVFIEKMTHHFSDRIQKILSKLKEVRQGQRGERTFFKRHQGKAPSGKSFPNSLNRPINNSDSQPYQSHQSPIPSDAQAQHNSLWFDSSWIKTLRRLASSQPLQYNRNQVHNLPSSMTFYKNMDIPNASC